MGAQVYQVHGERCHLLGAQVHGEVSFCWVHRRGVICWVHRFMGRGVIDRPMEDIVHFLEAHERRKEWDKYLVVRVCVCMHACMCACVCVCAMLKCFEAW